MAELNRSCNTCNEAKVINRGNCMMCGKKLTEGIFFCKDCESKAIQGRKRITKRRMNNEKK